MIAEKHSKWLEGRGLTPTIAEHMGCYSGRREADGSVLQDETGDIFVFPFIRNGVEVGAKYRGAQKSFWQKKDGRKQFFNADILDEPMLHDGRAALVITEGEVDALSVAVSGHPFVVSVPDGAPPPRDRNGQLIRVTENDPINVDQDVKYGFILNDWDSLSKIPRIIIAADSDEAGQRLAEELVRRLDRVRCSFVVYPDGCKDFNDVLVQHGAETVLDIIKNVKPYPIDGLFKEQDFPPAEPIKTYSTGWPLVDGYLTPHLGAFMVVGGFPGHGKSTWTMQLVANLAKMHKWPIAVASFEMQISPYVTHAIMGAAIGGKFADASQALKEKATVFINKYFTFIAPNRADLETEHDIDWLLDKMQTAVIREGVKCVLIDPWNEIEHRKKADESQTEYIGRAIKKLKSFAMQYNVLVIVVVHPTKASSQMDSEELGLYNLADSSHWANKADLGVIVGRIGDPEYDTTTGIYIKKIRYQPDAGKIGYTVLNFDTRNRLFR